MKSEQNLKWQLAKTGHVNGGINRGIIMKMKPDPVIERIRAIRRKISKECNHDPKVLVEHYRAMEKRFKNRILKRGLAKTI